MASGEIEVIPGRVFAPEEPVDPAKLNQLGTPTLRIKEQAITSRELADGTITSDKLSVDLEAQITVADNSITTNKILSGAVTSSKMADDAKMPIGMVVDFAGSTAPAGWLLCGGQAISRSTFAGLFGVIGVQFGVGDGVSTFNVPDLRGFVTAGKDNMATGTAGRLTSATIPNNGGPTELGGYGAAEKVTLVEAELAYHAHGVTAPDHLHQLPIKTTTQEGGSNYGLVAGGAFTGRVFITSAYGYQTTGGSDRTLGAITDYHGSNTPHNNVQPTMIMNKIIRYL